MAQTSLSQDIGSYLRYQLRGWRGLIAAAILLGAPALWLGWPWLVAAGLAPLLIAVAPCAIMCGLGLCANMACRKSDAASSSGPAADAALRVTIVSPQSEPEPSFGACCANEDSPSETKAALATANLSTQAKETIQ